MKKFIGSFVLVFFLVIIIYVLVPAPIPEPQLVPASFSFTPSGFESDESEFWYWDGGQYSFAFLHQKVPIAYYYGGVFYVAYDGRTTLRDDLDSKVYVYDMWGEDRHDEKRKQAFAIGEYASGWDDIILIMEDESKRRHLITPLEHTEQSIIKQLNNELKLAVRSRAAEVNNSNELSTATN